VDPNRLDSWKSIASYFGFSQRTVMRWHAERKLPIHRFPAGRSGSVFAYISELDTWRRGQSSSIQSSERPLELNFQGDSSFPGRERVAHLWEIRSENNLGEILDIYRAGIQQDWRNASAYAGLACSLLASSSVDLIQGSIALLQASVAAEKALSLDPDQPEAKCAKAWITFWHLRDYAVATGYFHEALEGKPDCTFAISGQIWVYAIQGQRDKASILIDNLIQKSGFSAHSALVACRVYFLNGELRRALHVAMEATASRNGGRTIETLGALSLLLIGNGEKAIRCLQNQARDFPEDAMVAGSLGYAYGMSGDYQNAERTYELLLKMSLERISGYGYPLAMTALAIGRHQEAIEWLEQSFLEECFHMLTLRSDPIFTTLRGNPRFDRLVQQTQQPSSRVSGIAIDTVGSREKAACELLK